MRREEADISRLVVSEVYWLDVVFFSTDTPVRRIQKNSRQQAGTTALQHLWPNSNNPRVAHLAVGFNLNSTVAKEQRIG